MAIQWSVSTTSRTSRNGKSKHDIGVMAFKHIQGCDHIGRCVCLLCCQYCVHGLLERFRDSHFTDRITYRQSVKLIRNLEFRASSAQVYVYVWRTPCTDISSEHSLRTCTQVRRNVRKSDEMYASRTWCTHAKKKKEKRDRSYRVSGI